MSAKKMPARKAVVDSNTCVACGCCMKVCPRNAITILRESAPSSIRICVSAAENARKNAPRVSLHWRCMKHETKRNSKQEMVRLSLDCLTDLSDSGISKYPVCVAWAAVLLYPAHHLCHNGQQSLLQQILRQRTVVCPRRRQIRPVPQKGRPHMAEIPLFQIWLPDILFRNVLSHAVEHLSRVCRHKGFEHCSDTAVDL